SRRGERGLVRRGATATSGPRADAPALPVREPPAPRRAERAPHYDSPRPGVKATRRGDPRRGNGLLQKPLPLPLPCKERGKSLISPLSASGRGAGGRGF